MTDNKYKSYLRGKPYGTTMRKMGDYHGNEQGREEKLTKKFDPEASSFSFSFRTKKSALVG